MLLCMEQGLLCDAGPAADGLTGCILHDVLSPAPTGSSRPHISVVEHYLYLQIGWLAARPTVSDGPDRADVAATKPMLRLSRCANAWPHPRQHRSRHCSLQVASNPPPRTSRQ